MPWFKVDDGFWSHPKTAGLSDAATALWVRAGSWSAQHLTDGRIPYSMLRFFRARRRSAMELVNVGLWSDAGDAFVFHGWADYQPSKSQVEAKREATKNRVNAWRERHGNGVTNASQPEDRNAAPDPTRPDPTHKKSSTNSLSKADAVRPDVEGLLDLLDAEIERNGSKKPTRNKSNRDAARLLLDRDGKTVEQVEKAIRFSQSDEFWRANVLSMSALRKNYDKLRLAAARGNVTPIQPPAEDIRDGFLFRQGKPVLGGPNGMNRDQYDAWVESELVKAGRRA